MYPIDRPLMVCYWLIMEKSRRYRYDPETKLWISTRKTNFITWYRFLQIAIAEKREIDWSCYGDWGDACYIKATDFNIWWKSKSALLFGHKEGEAPRFKLNTNKPQSEGMRYSLLLYEMKDEEGINGNTWLLAKEFAKREYPKRKKREAIYPHYNKDNWSFHYARVNPGKELIRENPKQFAREKRQVQSRVSRYLSQAELMLRNVCLGRFPK